MELALEKRRDLLLRPRADMWWLRKERLLVANMQHRQKDTREPTPGEKRPEQNQNPVRQKPRTCLMTHD